MLIKFSSIISFPSNRDYRWYQEDMIHPSQPAVTYIFEKFLKKYFSASTSILLKKIRTLNLNMEHKPRFIKSPTYTQHAQRCIRQILELRQDILRSMDYFLVGKEECTDRELAKRSLVKACVEVLWEDERASLLRHINYEGDVQAGPITTGRES